MMSVNKMSRSHSNSKSHVSSGVATESYSIAKEVKCMRMNYVAEREKCPDIQSVRETEAAKRRHVY